MMNKQKNKTLQPVRRQYFSESYLFPHSYPLVLAPPPRRLAPRHVGRNPWGSEPHKTRPERVDRMPDAPPRITSEEGGGRPALVVSDCTKHRKRKTGGSQPCFCVRSASHQVRNVDQTLTTSMWQTSSLKLGWALKFSISSDSSSRPAHSIFTRGRVTSNSSTRFSSRRPQYSTWAQRCTDSILNDSGTLQIQLSGVP